MISFSFIEFSTVCFSAWSFCFDFNALQSALHVSVLCVCHLSIADIFVCKWTNGCVFSWIQVIQFF